MRIAMAAHPDPLEEPERLGRGLASSLLFHVALVGALLVMGFLRQHDAIPMGDEHPGAGVQVNAVKTIPIPQKQGQINRLANDTESVVPQEPPKMVKLRDQRPEKQPEPEKAIEIPTEKPLKFTPKREPPVQYRPTQEYARNQVFTKVPEALKSPQIGQQGSNGVGIGPNSPFGFQFGAYAQQVRDLIARKWNQNGVTASASAKAVITFQILRNGTVTNVQLAEPSGSYTLDTSSRRAVLDANPLPPLPAGFSRNQADVELWFQLRR